MTDAERLKMLEHLTGETDQGVLSTYLFLAKGKVLSQAFPFGGAEEVPAEYETVWIEIAVFMLNKRGAEGEQRHSENGVDRTYDNSDIPKELLRKIVPKAGVMR